MAFFVTIYYSLLSSVISKRATSWLAFSFHPHLSGRDIYLSSLAGCYETLTNISLRLEASVYSKGERTCAQSPRRLVQMMIAGIVVL